jgi:hypothetical protein
MKNLNPYNQLMFQEKFKQTETYFQISQTYKKIFFDKFVEPYYEAIATPRQQIGISWASAVCWYYLDYLDTDCEMFDLGCGFNFFKPYFPTLTGIGAENDPNFFGDIHDFVDDDFYENHKDCYQSVFSINALHFYPIENLRNICKKFCAMLKPGGRGFLSLNAERMLERSTTMNNQSIEYIDSWVRQQFSEFPYKILVFDVDLSVKNAWLDGNIRIVFER